MKRRNPIFSAETHRETNSSSQGQREPEAAEDGGFYLHCSKHALTLIIGEAPGAAVGMTVHCFMDKINITPQAFPSPLSEHVIVREQDLIYMRWGWT